MAGGAETGRKLKLGDRVRFTRMMAGFRVRQYYEGGPYAKTTDPTDGRYLDQLARDRHRELTATEKRPQGRVGTFRIVVEFEPRQRQDYDLRKKDEGIIVGKTFRYEGEVLYDSEDYGQFMVGVGPIHGDPWRGSARRVECWEVKQSLHQRAVLVPLDAIELIGG